MATIKKATTKLKKAQDGYKARQGNYPAEETASKEKKSEPTAKINTGPRATLNTEKPSTRVEQTRGQAYAAARKAGKKTFEYNGKSYTTESAEEKAKRTAPSPYSTHAQADKDTAAKKAKKDEGSSAFKDNFPNQAKSVIDKAKAKATPAASTPSKSTTPKKNETTPAKKATPAKSTPSQSRDSSDYDRSGKKKWSPPNTFVTPDPVSSRYDRSGQLRWSPDKGKIVRKPAPVSDEYDRSGHKKWSPPVAKIVKAKCGTKVSKKK